MQTWHRREHTQGFRLSGGTHGQGRERHTLQSELCESCAVSAIVPTHDPLWPDPVSQANHVLYLLGANFTLPAVRLF